MPQRKHQVPAPEAPRRHWVTQSFVAAHLDVTTRTVRDMTADGLLRGYRLNRGFVRYDLNEVDAALQPFGGCASPTTPTNTATPSPSPTAHRLAGTQLHPSHGGTEHSRSHRPTQDPNTDPGVCRHET
jgi:hypothetical protein